MTRTVGVTSLAHLQGVITRLGRIQGVTKIERSGV